MKELNYREAHSLVDKHPDLFWDGYDIVHFSVAPHGEAHFRGMRRDGQWGIATRFSLSERGTWSVNYRAARLPRSR